MLYAYLKLFSYLSVVSLLLSWPPVRELCPNHEVVVFQPQTGTSPDLGSITYCYIAVLLSPTPPFPSASQCLPEGATHSCLSPSHHNNTIMLHTAHRIGSSDHLIFAHLHRPFPHLVTLCSLIRVPPPFPRPCHTFQITVAAPLPPPKYLLTYPSDISELPFSATASHGASPLPPSLYPHRKPHVVPYSETSRNHHEPITNIKNKPKVIGVCKNTWDIQF